MIDRSMGWISAGTADIIYMSMGGLTQVNIYDRYVYGVDCRRYSRYDRQVYGWIDTGTADMIDRSMDGLTQVNIQDIHFYEWIGGGKSNIIDKAMDGLKKDKHI